VNILVLHGLGEEKSWISSWEDIELMFPRYDRQNSYLVHNCYLELPGCVKTFPFDAIIMMSTFVDWVKRYVEGDQWLKQYDFLKHSLAKKIVFSQDDYWLSEVRDEFYVGMNVDMLLPVCPRSTWMDFYPKYLSKPRNVQQGYTIYLTERITGLISKVKPWAARKWDVIYRASGAPTYPNSLGYMKAEIGEIFKSRLGPNHGLSLNISTSTESFIAGSEWYDFIVDSRAILGSNSGSSVNVRNHDVVAKLKAYKGKNPQASLDDIQASVFEADDINKNYTCISPRNVEAAMLGTLQILVPGEYGGIMKPYQHYVPLLEDGSNIKEVITILRDEASCEAITSACRERFLNTSQLQVKNVIDEVLLFVSKERSRLDNAHLPRKGPFVELKQQYQSELRWSKATYHARQGVSRFRSVLKYLNSLKINKK